MKYSCAIIVGEPSADVLGEEILKSSPKDIFWFGVGGPLMKNNGLYSIMDWNSIRGFGLGDVLLRIPILLYNSYKLADIIIDKKPDIIFTVDNKGFNFFLLRIIRKKIRFKEYKPKIIHVVAPTVWAWRTSRSKNIKGLMDKLLCLFPSEPPYFTKHGIDAIYIGHPAVNNLSILKNRSKLFSLIGLKDNNQKVIALLPGSRKSEVKRILPELIDCVKILKKKSNKSLIFLLQMASNQEKVINFILKKNKDIIILDNNKFGKLLLNNADFSILTCGTATLEYAIAGVPGVAIYKAGFLSAFIGRRIINMKNIVLPNWLLSKKVMSFLFQEKCQSEIIASSLLKLINDPNSNLYSNNISQELKKILTVNNKSFKKNISSIIKENLC